MKRRSHPGTFIIDLARLNELNAEGCAACGRKFNLGDTAVWARGSWQGEARVIHVDEAVYDAAGGGWVERGGPRT